MAPLPDGLVLEPEARVLLWLDAEGTVEGTLPLGLAREGEVLRLFDPRGEEADVLAWPELGLDASWARIPDGTGEAEAMPVGTPGAPNVRLVERRVRLVLEGQDWRYLDGRQLPVGGMAGAWNELDFNDDGWGLGPAPLGYGDIQSTVLDDGFTDAGRAMTAWFRHSFEIGDGANVPLEATLGLRADDGARVFLDGVELVRLGMPSGDIGPETAASRTVSGDGERTYEELAIDERLLTPGPHVLAVDLHQANPWSSDLTFDLWLDVVRLEAE